MRDGVEEKDRYETRGSEVLFWFLWVGLGLATAGEVVLFTMMGSGVAHGADAVGQLPASQFTIVGLLTVAMVVLAATVKRLEIGGGGLPTAIFTWVLLKGVAITGLVVYQLASNHAYYWPFLGIFAVGMLLANPGSFRTTEGDSEAGDPELAE